MSTTQLSSLPLQWTPRPAPFLPGLFSAQASALNDAGDQLQTSRNMSPSVSVYRTSLKDATSWIQETARKGGRNSYFLRHSESEVDLHDPRGKFVKKLKSPMFQAVPEAEGAIVTSRDAMLHEAREALRNPQVALLACAEDHAGASAADHSNFVIICRRMIIEATPVDLDKFFVVESQRWDCRVTGIYADVSSLSRDMQDIFLERFKWIHNSWPLNARHHMDMLADRLVRSRSSYVTELLLECGRAAGLTYELTLTLQSKWMLAPPGAKYRFAQHLVETMKEGIVYEPSSAETFTDEVVASRGGEVVKDFRTILR